MTKKREVCIWCLYPVVVPENHKPKKLLVCSTGCRDAEMLFQRMFSDEEINRRDHYTELTRGDDGQG